MKDTDYVRNKGGILGAADAADFHSRVTKAWLNLVIQAQYFHRRLVESVTLCLMYFLFPFSFLCCKTKAKIPVRNVLAGEKRGRERTSGGKTLCSVRLTRKRKNERRVVVSAGLGTHRRSLRRRRKSFLVCAISASLGSGGKTWKTHRKSEREQISLKKRTKMQKHWSVLKQHAHRVQPRGGK